MDRQALGHDDASFEMAGSQFGVMLFPDMPRGIREMARVVKPGGRVLMNVYGDPHAIEFLSFFVRAVQAARPDFTGPPMEPPPLPFQLQDPRRLASELADAGLKDVTVETIIETTQFQDGPALWEWLIFSDPIVEAVLDSLVLADDERGTIQRALDTLVRERAKETGRAALTNSINVGIGTK